MIGRIFGMLAFVLGFTGFVGCLAAIVFACIASGRLSHVADPAFGIVDRSLVAVEKRVGQTQNRVEAAKITTEGIEKSLKSWSKKATGERLASRLDVAKKTERLTATLQQADRWLDVSQASIELMQQVMAMVNATGAPSDVTVGDGLTEEITSLRRQIAQATQFAESIYQRTTEANEEEPREERIEQAVRLALRVVATLGSINVRLKVLEGRLSQTRVNSQRRQITIRRWILGATFGIVLLFVWMAVGQAALCTYGWKGLRGRRVSTTR